MDISINKADGILTIGFNRPEKKNAITAAMYQTMADTLQQGESDPAVRVIMLVGLPGIFTAGNDLEDFLKNPPQAENSPVAQYMHALSHASKPVIAAVSGAAVGIGTTLLPHCDLVYAADDAKFAMPFTQLGLCPEFASSLTIQRLGGYQRAAEKLMLGEVFKVDEALAMGLVNKVLPQAELLPYARAQALKLVALPAASIRATKQLMKRDQMQINDAMMLQEMKSFSAMLKAPEAKEAFTAFLEKRRPDFSRFS
jgi:enoyl-CoA hydratase/carnithine racemase